jgi:hypothetical protein
MGFLNWLAGQPEENSQESQLDLLGNSQPVRGRADGATVRKDFTGTIKGKGGSDQAIARSTNKMTEEIFGCKTNELYEKTNGRRGDRTSLPQDAQSAYIVGETAATHRLKDLNTSGNQQQRDAQIVDTVQDSAKEVKGLFPWNW